MEHKTLAFDSCFWISLLDIDDSNHSKAMEIFAQISPQQILLNDHIYAEILNVLRRKRLQFKIDEFMGFIAELNLKIEIVDSFVINLANKLFNFFTSISFTDAVILANARLKRAHLITFDKKLRQAFEQNT